MARRLNIAFIVNDFPCISETFILNQITGLLELGHAVDIFAYNREGEDQKQHTAVSKYNLLKRAKYFPAIPRGRVARLVKLVGIVFVQMFRHPVWLRKCLNFKKYGAYASLNHLFHLELLMNKKYDIIHCQYGTIGQDWAYIKEIVDTKLAVSFRGYDLMRMVLEHGPGVYKELFDKGDVFLPVSQYFAKKLEEMGCSKRKIRVLYSGIDVQKYQYRERTFDFQEKIELLSAGRLVEKKGIKYVIYAVEKLVKQYPGVRYTIVGTGKAEDELKRLSGSLKLEDNIHFINGLSDDEMQKIYEKSQIFVLPCVQAQDHDQEGIPNVLKEAMATGLPVISTRHSGIPELVQDGVSGFLVPERDVDGLVSKCEYLISHPQRCAEMGRLGRKFVEKNFEISQLNQRLIELYAQPLNTLPGSKSEKCNEHRLSY